MSERGSKMMFLWWNSDQTGAQLSAVAPLR